MKISGRPGDGPPTNSVGLATQLDVPPAGAATVETLENVLFAFDPRVVMAAMHTTMMRASMTAYSTAVGPSSFFRKWTRARMEDRMGDSGWGGTRAVGGRRNRHDRYNRPTIL